MISRIKAKKSESRQQNQSRSWASTLILTKKINLINSNIKIIKDNYDLSSIINKTSFYIGSNSSIVNELSYLKIPRLLISVNEKQNVNIKSYQKYGNYFCINHPDSKKQNKIAELALEMLFKYDRVKKIFSNTDIKIDNLGSKRIVNLLLKKI